MADENNSEAVRGLVTETLSKTGEALQMLKTAEAKIAAVAQERDDLQGRLKAANDRIGLLEGEKVQLEKVAALQQTPIQFSSRAIAETIGALEEAGLCSHEHAVKMASIIQNNPAYALDVIGQLANTLSQEAPKSGQPVKRAAFTPPAASDPAEQAEDWSLMAKHGA